MDAKEGLLMLMQSPSLLFSKLAILYFAKLLLNSSITKEGVTLAATPLPKKFLIYLLE